MTAQTFNPKSVKSAVAAIKKLPAKNEVLFAAGVVKPPKTGTIADRFVQAFKVGATLDEVKALIPATNTGTPKEFVHYMKRYGFGIRQSGNKFFLLEA